MKIHNQKAGKYLRPLLDNDPDRIAPEKTDRLVLEAYENAELCHDYISLEELLRTTRDFRNKEESPYYNEKYAFKAKKLEIEHRQREGNYKPDFYERT